MGEGLYFGSVIMRVGSLKSGAAGECISDTLHTYASLGARGSASGKGDYCLTVGAYIIELESCLSGKGKIDLDQSLQGHKNLYFVSLSSESKHILKDDIFTYLIYLSIYKKS